MKGRVVRKLKEQPKKKLIEPKKKTIITKQDGTDNGFLN